ncbi:MFS transporter [soil metagenome]
MRAAEFNRGVSLTVDDPTTIGTGRRWSMLGASTLAQASAAVMMHGPAFLIPALHDREGLSLAQAGVVAASPVVGVMLTLVAWGLLTDRRGERLVLLTGLVLTTVAGLVATQVTGLVPLSIALFLGGAAAASTNYASGRVVVGWFPPQRRGLAMGIRQMAQPTGVGVAAISIAVLADRHGVYAALWVPTVATAIAAVVVALVVVDPPRPARGAQPADNPYRADTFLARIHGVSVLLVVPQFVVWTFALVWLVQDRGWSPAAAGGLVAGAQVAGALGRIAAGQLSDQVGSRMRPLRWVAVAAGITMALLGATAGLDWAVAVPLIVVATVLTVADNGLAFTAVAERAGPHWSGRALGVQNTAQFLISALVPPLGGLAVTHAGYAATFGLAALFPLVAVTLVPVGQERALS